MGVVVVDRLAEVRMAEVEMRWEDEGQPEPLLRTWVISEAPTC